MMFAKREKPEDDEAVNLSLHNHHDFAEATLRAVELKDELTACKTTVSRLTLRAARGINFDARAFVNRGGRALPNMEQLQLEAVARKIIAGAKVEDEVKKLRSSETDSIYDRLVLQDASDLAFIRTLDDARAAAEILGCAVALHDAAVTRLRSQAIAEIARALKPRRDRLARQIGKALSALRDALEDETTFANELASQDAGPELAQQMQPRLFPLHILGDPALVAWIRSAQRLGLMANLPQPDSSEGERDRDVTALVSGAGTIAAGGAL
jgi:hypothetical protein